MVVERWLTFRPPATLAPDKAVSLSFVALQPSTDFCSSAAAAVTSAISDSVWPHRWQPTRLRHLWDSPGKNTGYLRKIKLPTLVGSSKKQESSRKTSTSALLTMPKPLIMWITTNCGKFLKRWEYQITWPASWEICMEVRKQQLEMDMEQQTSSILGKEYVKAVYCHPAYLTYIQSTSWEMLGWRKHKLE